jgi:putative ABC transport system ATP-binding protein
MTQVEHAHTTSATSPTSAAAASASSAAPASPASPASLARPAGEAAASIMSLRGVTKIYQRGDESLRVLDNLNLEVPEGSFEALMGPSGSGKSTLLHLIAGLDKASSGTVRVAGHELTQMSETELAKWRASTIGFVFQSYNLIPVLTALQNVQLPLLLTHLPAAERKKRAELALKIVGLAERMHHFPRQLSGGQEQRVAIARAIVNDPKIIVADEPTGDLDRKSADEILGLLEKLNQELGKTIFMVTHDPQAAERAKQLRRLDKGGLL